MANNIAAWNQGGQLDAGLLGEMVRQYRKLGGIIPEGQPKTSQEGEEIADEFNRLRTDLDIARKHAKVLAEVCQRFLDWNTGLEQNHAMEFALDENRTKKGLPPLSKKLSVAMNADQTQDALAWVQEQP